ncbi:MAG: hypothetical protein IJ568_02010 [Bacilli bacterium]|nr:hypothetical protein [Bacilli bacterium]
MKVKLSSKKVIIIEIIFLFLGLFFIESKTSILTTALRGNDPTEEIRKDELISNRSNYSDYKYTCNDTSSTCTETNLRMITAYSTTGYTYAYNHYWGSSVTWDGTNYTLVDPIEIENYNNTTNLSTHHYMCAGNGLKVCSQVGYVYYLSGTKMYYVLLENEKK